MATYYVNLSLGTDSHDGSEGDPFSGNDFFTNASGSTYNTYYLKGSYDGFNLSGISSGHHILLSWNAASNDPWRMNLTGVGDIELFNLIKIEGAIINVSGANNLIIENGGADAIEFDDCFLKMHAGCNFAVGYGASNTYKGCTIVIGGSGGFLNNGTAGLVLLDCVVDAVGLHANWFGGGSVTSTNCAFTASSYDGSWGDTNSQFSWTPPSWPAWDAAQSAFNSSVLSVDIGYPPEVGNPPYTDYLTGLWGETRLGIGAMNFDSLPPEPTTTTTPPPAATYQEAVLATSGLVSYWKMDGDWTDSKDSNNGTPVGGATFGSGRIGSNSGQFDGSGTYTNVGTNPNLDVQSSEFSIEAWVYFNQFQSDSILFQNGEDNGGCFLFFNRFGSNNIALTKSHVIDQLVSYTFNNNQWYHIVVSQKFSGGHPSEVDYYINGQLIGTYSDVQDYLPSSGYGKSICGTNAGNHPINGLVDELAVYNVALDESTVIAHYNAAPAEPTTTTTTTPAPIADFYVDLSLGTNGHIGTTIDPFSFNDFVTSMASAPIENTYHLKGTFDSSVTTISIQSNMVAWEPSVNAPWRMNIWQTNDFGDPNVIISGGIIQSGQGDLNNPVKAANYIDMYLISTASRMRPIGPATYKGCTINCPNQIQFVDTNGHTFIDCIFITSAFSTFSTYDATLQNCVCSIADPGFPSSINSQFDWSAPTMPAWNDPQSSFDSSVLSIGINFPPEPGTIPYTGYETGLWQESRLGIGAMNFNSLPGTSVSYFNAGSVLDGSSVTSIISTINLIERIQAYVPDPYFDETVEINKVYIYYTHEDGRQQKKILHVNGGLPLIMGETTVPTDPYYHDEGDPEWVVTNKATLSTGGTIQSLSFYVVSGSGGQCRLGIYDLNGSIPGNLLAQTSPFTPTGMPGWQTYPVIAPVFLSAGDYFIAFQFSNGDYHWKKYVNPAIVYEIKYGTSTPWAGGFPAVWGTSDAGFSQGSPSWPGWGYLGWPLYATVSVPAIIGTVSWSSLAHDGAWQKTKIKVVDPDGASRVLPRAAIGILEDLSHSGGVMTLNTI